MFDEGNLFLLEPPTTVVAAQIMTENPPPATVNNRLPIAPAPIPVGMALHRFLPASAVAAAPALVAPDTTDVAAEPQTAQQPILPTQDVPFTDDNYFQKK